MEPPRSRPTHPAIAVIRRVWIEEGCISCNLCEDLVPEVFEVPAGDTCRPTKNHQAKLGGEEMQERVREAAESCPVEVIQLDED